MYFLKCTEISTFSSLIKLVSCVSSQDVVTVKIIYPKHFVITKKIQSTLLQWSNLIVYKKELG